MCKFYFYCHFTKFLFVDLAEVMSVSSASPAPGAPKKTDDKSFFDVSFVNFQVNDH